MEVGDARADLDVFDNECGWSDGGAAREFEVLVYGVRAGAGGVGELHVGAGADEEGRGCVAAIRYWAESGSDQDQGAEAYPCQSSRPP